MAVQHEILKKYWGFDLFRPKQEEIVIAILNGQDTLALLPTGGGKSVCFQVPALCMDGICIVVSPLMALMHDQVANLKKRGINSHTVNSSLSAKETDRILDNCVYGDVKFLYVSPERLRNELFLERFKKMKVSMIAVDEAHCISQWGYDFRPEYLMIAEIRTLKPDIPVLALTASATPAVVADIQDKLKFKTHHVVGTSFARKNLSYNVSLQEDKEKKLVEICKKMKGCGIIYCGTRLRTREIAELINKNKISALYYHAGLSIADRDSAFKKWMRNEYRIICATNAFGMGIDKPDVRFVLHADVPAQPEAYFQEAGRAGRDGDQAWAVLLWNESDIAKIHKQIEAKYPPKEFIKKVYKNIGNYLQLPPGAGFEMSYEFDLGKFCQNFELKPLETTSALKILELSGYLSMNDVSFMPSRIYIRANRQDLYSFQVTNPMMDGLVKVLLRMYGGLFEQYVAIRENDIATNSKIQVAQVIERLRKMKELGILDYEQHTETPKLTMLTGRQHEDNLVIPVEVYENRLRTDKERAMAMERYITKTRCRSVQLLEYFGEKFPEPCGQCDICRENKKNGLSPEEYEALTKSVMEIALRGNISIEQLPSVLPAFNKEHLIEFVRWKIDRGELVLTDKLSIALPGMENE